MTKRSYIQSMVKAIEHCKETHPDITACILLSINREHNLEAAMETVALAKEFSNTVVGIDYSGNPLKGSFSELQPALEHARKEGLPITIHFAEVYNTIESLQILEFGPERLGHASCMNDTVKRKLYASRIPVEVCISSNLATGSVRSLEKHQFVDLKSHSHPLVICTDDKGIFGSGISKEYYSIASAFELDAISVFDMSFNSIDHIFGGRREKDRLKTLFATWKNNHISNM